MAVMRSSRRPRPFLRAWVQTSCTAVATATVRAGVGCSKAGCRLARSDCDDLLSLLFVYFMIRLVVTRFAGQVAKLCNNLILGVTMSGVSEVRDAVGVVVFVFGMCGILWEIKGKQQEKEKEKEKEKDTDRRP